MEVKTFMDLSDFVESFLNRKFQRNFTVTDAFVSHATRVKTASPNTRHVLPHPA